MQLLKRVKWVYVLLSVFLMALGVCLFLFPDISFVVMCCAIGGGAVVLGIVKIVLYFLREVEAVGEQNDFAIGAMCVIAGAVLLIHPTAILNMVPQVLGVYMLIDCVFKLQIALDAKRLGSKGWWLSLVVTLICIVWGLLLVWQPSFLIANIRAVLLIAGGLVADGVQNLLGVIYMAATVRRTEAEGGEITEPAEFEPAAELVAPAAEPTPVETPKSAEEPETKKKFNLFGKKDEPKDDEKPAAEAAPVEPEPEEDDGAVMEINFEMTEEETHELHS